MELKEILGIDPVAEAEKIGGDALTILSVVAETNKLQRAALEAAGDTSLGTKLDQYLSTMAILGFKVILKDDVCQKEKMQFSGKQYEVNKESSMYILWNDEDSVLLSFDSYSSYQLVDGEVKKVEESINGGSFYYNWIPNVYEDIMKWTHSGGIVKPKNMSWDEFDKIPNSEKVFSGHHDCRNAAIMKYQDLKENGDFVKKWTSRPFLWLVHYSEQSETADYKRITSDRLNRLPEYIKKCIG